MNIEKRRAEIAARKAEIRAFLEADDGKVDIDALEKELRALNDEDAALEKRQAVERMLNSGGAVGSPVANPVQRRDEGNDEENERLYRSAWLKSLQGKPLTDAEQRAYTTAAGSALPIIPETTANQIIKKMYEVAPIIQRCRIFHVPGNFKFAVEDVNDDAELHTEERYIFSGMGANEPGGVKIAGKGTGGAYTDGKDQITVAKTASLTETDVISLYGLLGDGYERNAVWTMRKATFFSDFFPLMNKSKNNLIEFAGGKYYIMGAEVYFTGSVPASEAYLGDFSYIVGNYSQDITIVKSEHSGLATNSIDFLGSCVFDSKPAAGLGAFVHLAKATA